LALEKKNYRIDEHYEVLLSLASQLIILSRIEGFISWEDAVLLLGMYIFEDNNAEMRSSAIAFAT
jgi:hypothetical protein